jgi:NAD-dependent dihydropyrimidine dehydrogenase PreA subunit
MSEPDKCPLCGGNATVFMVSKRQCHNCGLPVELWPKVARLVESEKMLEWMLADIGFTRAAVDAAMKGSE